MAVMLITASNVFAQAHFETIDGLRYLIDENAKAATLVANPDEKYSGDIVVPEKVTAKDEKEYPVTAFGDNCFLNCLQITSITIPSSVTFLGYCCFDNCRNLSKVTIPSSVKQLGDGCFGGCSSLKSLELPLSVTSLGEKCFSASGITKISIPSSVKHIGYCCFGACYNLEDISLPTSISVLEGSLFVSCTSLKVITIPASVTSIESKCFEDCTSLTSISIPSSITSIGDYCFSGCTSLTNINLPNSIKELSSSCFSGCLQLTNITIPSSVTEIDKECFAKCSSLSSIEIPSSITSLGSSCFYGCSHLETIYFKGQQPTGILQSDISETSIFIVPQNYLQDYKNTLVGKYKYIYAWGGEPGDNKPIPSCEVPIITYADGSLHFFSSTTGAEYHYVIEAPDATSGNYSKDGEVALSAAYKLSAYATADGYQPSDKATATLYWLNANLENDPSTNINQAKTRGIVASSDGGIVTLSGLNNGEVVKFFSPDGRQLGAAKAENGIASCAVSSSIVIAKIGSDALKIAVK